MATILIVEDDPLHQAFLVEVLGELGFDLHVYGDGGEAWAYLCTEPRVDLLLTDVGLPTLSGLELVARVRGLAWATELPVVVRSAMDAGVGAVRAAAAGADAFVSKGAPSAELIPLLRLLLGVRCPGAKA